MFEQKVILVVDDDLTLLEMYMERIKSEGAIVLVAKNGEEAIQLAKENHPNVILLDIMMPKINGLDVLKSLKEDEITREIPIIMLTALADPDKVKQAYDLGVNDYVVKSEVLPMDVIAKVRNYLQQ